MDNVIVVASGKGGTGKSTVCICLSVALVKQGKRVLLIDCDCGMRGLAYAFALLYKSNGKTNADG